jgi:NAD(P)-dependent dehydrogenase (short-subunit alcohol dehydrogenase family)
VSDGQRILIAGSRGGIGGACAAALQREGALVHGVDRPECDITQPGLARRAIDDAIAELGRIDGIVHALGMSGRRLGDGPVTTVSDEAWDEVLRVNLTSVFWLVREGLSTLIQQGGGSLVIIGSVLAQTADEDFMTAAYATSKAALLGLVRLAALEGAPHGVRVNVVAAGLVDTAMSARARSNDRITDRLRRLQPLGGTLVAPDDVASAVLWLLSAASARTTGASIPVDGGWVIR